MDAVVFDGLIFPVKIGKICDLIIDGQESSRLTLGLEPFHDPLPSSPRLKRGIRQVVQALPVRDLDSRRSRLSSKLAHQGLGAFPAALALEADIESEAVRVDVAPQPMFLAGEGDADFIQTPLIASPWGPTTNNLGDDLCDDNLWGADLWRETVAAIKGGRVRHCCLSTVPISSAVSPNSLPHLPLTWFPFPSP